MSEYTLNRWTLPSHYVGAEWSEYFVFLGRNRDSDDLTESNFECGLKAIGGESDTVRVIRESHWACGWIEWIAIHESDESALAIASELIDALNDYPVIDEEDWSNRESESADNFWRDCFDDKDRVAYIREWRDQFYFHNMADLIACARGRYFNGYASAQAGLAARHK